MCDKLSEVGHHVRIFDIHESSYLRDDQTMVVGDITDEQRVREAVAMSKVVFNFAGIADIDEARQRPLDTVRHNIHRLPDDFLHFF